GGSAAALHRYASIVAISGAIMPEPLQKPLIRMVVPSIVAVAVAPFGKVSVVMIARAAGSHLAASSNGTIFGSASTIFAAGGGSPITPVDEMKTSRGLQRNSSEVAAAVRSQTSRPARPVNTLALPELTTIARAEPPGRQARHQSTGAPGVFDCVSTPEIVVPGASSASMTSFRPL